MNYEQYKMLKELLKIKVQEAKTQKEEIEKQIKEIVYRYVQLDNVEVTSISDTGDGWYIDVSVVDKDGKGVWACEGTLHYRNGTWDKKGIDLNYGCSGAFTSENEGQIVKLTMLSKLAQSLDKIEANFDAIKRDKLDAVSDVRHEVDRAKRQLLVDYEKEIESKLAVDNECTDRHDNTLKITHITPKFVHYTINGGYGKKERKSDFLSKQAKLKFERLEEQDKQEEQEQ